MAAGIVPDADCDVARTLTEHWLNLLWRQESCPTPTAPDLGEVGRLEATQLPARREARRALPSTLRCWVAYFGCGTMRM